MKRANMRVALLTRKHHAISLHLYENSIINILSKMGLSFVQFPEDGPIPDNCDLIWEPSMAGNRIPAPILKDAKIPIVATVLGAAPISMNQDEFVEYDEQRKPIQNRNEKAIKNWEWFRSKVTAVIAISQFTANEATRLFGVDKNKIFVVHLGVDHSIFNAAGERYCHDKPYILVVSQYKPRKNVKRVFEAHSLLQKNTRPKIIAVLPDYKSQNTKEDDLMIFNYKIPTSELIKLYRGALFFIFPSLYEGFGLPIIEAMACGTPVITSSSSACPEVAGDSALLIDPRSTDDMANAMQKLIDDEGLRSLYSQKGLARAGKFTWEKSAKEHLFIFDRVVKS